MIDDLIALRLQLDWGADEALGDVPIDRFGTLPAAVALRAPARVEAALKGARAEPTARLPGQAAVEAQTLDALHAELDAFTACPLRATATHTVRPSGAADAPLLLIGDAPGSEDDRSGQAFSGPPGAMLDRVMASCRLGPDPYPADDAGALASAGQSAGFGKRGSSLSSVRAPVDRPRSTARDLAARSRSGGSLDWTKRHDPPVTRALARGDHTNAAKDVSRPSSPAARSMVARRNH